MGKGYRFGYILLQYCYYHKYYDLEKAIVDTNEVIINKNLYMTLLSENNFRINLDVSEMEGYSSLYFNKNEAEVLLFFRTRGLNQK